MVKKFPSRKEEHNLKDIYLLLREVKNDLKIVEAKNPYNYLFTQCLELATKKIAIAENRLSAESFIDGLFISNVIAALKEADENLSVFKITISKVENATGLTFPPYKINIHGE